MTRPILRSAITTFLAFSFLRDNAVMSNCSFPVNTKAPKTPLILKSISDEFYYPHSDAIIMSKNARIRLSCSDKRFTNFPYRQLNATCVKDDIFMVDKRLVHFKDLECFHGFPASKVMNKTVKCHGGNQIYKVGFVTEKTFIKTMNLCFNSNEEKVLYSWYFSPRIHKGHQSGVQRPYFAHDDLYSFNISASFSFKQQVRTFTTILKSRHQALKYIKNDGKHFLARGHLTPKADFVYGVEQASTFHYANVAPQWQVFNEGNWEKLESDLRSLLKKYKHRYRVVTGTHGIATLPDIHNRYQKLYIHVKNNARKVPVPRLFWKVVYDKRTRTGVAIIGVNNPYLEKVPASYKLCKISICNQIEWLSLNYNDTAKGFSYCCTINQFVRATGYVHIFKIFRISDFV